jgi:hypothetical protein
MWKKFRQFVNDLAPPYRSDYMDRHAEMQAAYERLRDEFAMAALTSMLSEPQKLGDDTPSVAAKWAYKFAAAMMETRAALGEKE